MMTVEIQETCYFCQKSLVEEEWVWVCSNCKITWHDAHKKTHFKWNALWGLDKEICPNCGRSLKNNHEVLPKFSDWQERFGVKPPAPALAQPVNPPQQETPKPQPAPAVVSGPPKPKKKSIFIPIILLIPFGALAVYGFIALFTLWEDGLYWILLSLGCIMFGGRIALASIREIAEYFQQKQA